MSITAFRCDIDLTIAICDTRYVSFRSRTPIRVLRAYAGLFDQRGTREFAAAGFVSRLTSSMVFISLILAITERGGGYATAGAVIGALTLAAGVALPVFGALIDRYGQHRVLVPQALAFGGLMLLLTVAVEAREQEWLLVVLAAAAGVPMPAAGPLVRARWTKIYQGTDKLRIAYGFESATIETVEIAGPILVTALVTGIGPLAGLAAVLTCALGGTLALAAQRGTEPEPAGRVADGVVGNSLRIPALQALYAARFCVGAVFGAMPVSLIAFATAHHGRAFSGLFLGLYGVTSLIAGLGYGALKEQMPLHRRLVVSVTLFAAGGIPLLAARGLFSLVGLLPLAGVAMAPATVTAMEVMQRVVPPALLTQTISWDTTAIAFGMTAGSFLAGATIAPLGADYAFVVPACAGLLSLIAVLAGSKPIRAACLAPRR
jgi:MFS family permease